MSVVLPAPLTPTIAVVFPASSVRLSPANTVSDAPGYEKYRSRNSIECAGAPGGTASVPRGAVSASTHRLLDVADGAQRVHPKLRGGVRFWVVAPEHERADERLQPKREGRQRHGARRQLAFAAPGTCRLGRERDERPQHRGERDRGVHEVRLEVDAAPLAVDGVRELAVRLGVTLGEPRHGPEDANLLGRR